MELALGVLLWSAYAMLATISYAAAADLLPVFVVSLVLVFWSGWIWRKVTR